MNIRLGNALPAFVGLWLWILTCRTAAPFYTLAAILLHEGGHYAVAALCGHAPKGLTCRPLGALLQTPGLLSYREEILVAFGGPLANIICVLFCAILGFPLSSFFPSVSLSLALLNLLPIAGFDGGRITACLCGNFLPPAPAERVCRALSFFCLFCLWSISVYLLMRQGASLSLFVFSVTIFLRLF